MKARLEGARRSAGGSSSRWAVVATETIAQEAAASLLPKASAVDAVVAGVFAAAAVTPSVLLGPVQLLLGGAGMGLLAVDGRLRQPGRSVARPRGFVGTEAIPAAAFFAVPALPAALAATRAITNSVTLLQVLGPALELAKGKSAARHDVLRRLSRRGPQALAEEPIASELVAAGGRLAGGVLTVTDLSEVRPVVTECRCEGAGAGAVERRDHRVAVAPWLEVELTGPRVEILAAVDGQGRVAIACYESVEEGISIPALDLVAPRSAAPVRRGETRVRPGQPIAAASPIALLETAGVLEAALGFAHATERGPLATLLADFARGISADESIRVSSLAGHAPVGVLRTRSTAHSFK